MEGARSRMRDRRNAEPMSDFELPKARSALGRFYILKSRSARRPYRRENPLLIPSAIVPVGFGRASAHVLSVLICLHLWLSEKPD